MERIGGYCIDSDILIDYLRGLEAARGFLLKTSREAPLSISIISVVEIYAGEETSDQKKRILIDEFLQNFDILGLDLDIARYAGALRRDYQKPFADMIVAATALYHDLTLVTKNTKHFQTIEGLTLLRPY